MAGADIDMIIGGDFNVVADSSLDRSAQRFGQGGSLSSEGKRLLSDMGFTDIWRHQLGTIHIFPRPTLLMPS